MKSLHTNIKKTILSFLLFFSAFFLLFPQEDVSSDFNFGETENNQEGNFSVGIGGSLYAGANFFFKDFKNLKTYKPTLPVWGNLHIEAKAPLTEAYFGVVLNGKTLPVRLGEQAESLPKPIIPPWIEQAYMQVITDYIVFGGGVKKMTWGRADAMSVLDVLNPRDYTDFSELDTEKIKIPQPMFYLSAYMPFETKLSLVYLPIFEPNRFTVDGRWKSADFSPGEVEKLKSVKTNTYKYSQGGARFTFSLDGVFDGGLQYFYGVLPFPVLKAVNGKPEFSYNRYHHVGMDCGIALGLINLRGEFAANITNDLKGDNPYIYNPNLAWNLGFDYALPLSISIAAHIAETIRLNRKHIQSGADSLDMEKDLKTTDTRIMFTISQKLVRGSLEWKIVSIIGIEDKDFMISPGLHWQAGTILIDADLGFFGGKKNGKLGRFRDNHFVKLSVGYAF